MSKCQPAVESIKEPHSIAATFYAWPPSTVHESEDVYHFSRKTSGTYDSHLHSLMSLIVN